MDEYVAVVGSRDGAPVELIHQFLDWLWEKNPRAIVVSGGARGADKTGETYWVEKGGRVLSYRVKKLSYEEYGTEAWYLGPWEGGPRIEYLYGHPTAANYTSALLYRDALIAERCTEHFCAFHRPGGSRGTAITASFAEHGEGKTVHVVEGGRDES